jgi:phage terminase large subunit
LTRLKVNKPVYDPLNSGKSIHVHQGGTSSGKTYGILQYLFQVGAENNGEIITVVAEDVPNLKSGAFRDAQSILNEYPVLKQWYPILNKSDRFFKSLSGSIIEFKSFQDEYDARSGKRDRLFINEANSVKYGIYEQLALRTSKQTIIDFNPSSKFWAHEQLQGRDDVEWVVTTFNDNDFLNDNIRDKILSYEPTKENIAKGTANEYRWRVYGLGEVGRLEGLIFPDFKEVEDFPKEYKWNAYGLDFGFTNDPTALIEIRYAHGQLYFKEHIYQTGLTNSDIFEELERIGFDITSKIIADSAEPKSIEELTRLGLHIEPAQKGKDSVIHGINLMQQYRLNVDIRSKGLVEEFNSYMWDKGRDGKPKNKPIDKFNHGIDAIRYALQDKVGEKEQLFFI